MAPSKLVTTSNTDPTATGKFISVDCRDLATDNHSRLHPPPADDILNRHIGQLIKDLG